MGVCIHGIMPNRPTCWFDVLLIPPFVCIPIIYYLLLSSGKVINVKGMVAILILIQMSMKEDGEKIKNMGLVHIHMLIKVSLRYVLYLICVYIHINK